MATETFGEGLTLGQMLAANLGACLRGEITAEEAQANADAFRRALRTTEQHSPAQQKKED